MREIDVRELREIQIGILKKVTDFCEQRNINYSLYGGTLLGAIRHKGYIPWDDDIDISMPRPDYNKFIKEFHFINDKNLKLHALELIGNCPYPFIKVSDERTLLEEFSNINYNIGINIDIFPIDGLPDSNEISEKIMRKSTFYRNLIEIKRIKFKKREIQKNLFLIITKPILFFIPSKYLLNKIAGLTKKYSYTDSNYIGNIVWGYGNKERCPKEHYNGYVKVRFENDDYNAMVGYDGYLRGVFDDYMQLPPEEKRVSHHKIVAYMK